MVDLFQGNGTFLLINHFIKLTRNQVISFGSSYFTFEISEYNTLQIQCINGPLKGQSFTFATDKEVIKMGRHSSSDIRINEIGLSRTQCIIV